MPVRKLFPIFAAVLLFLTFVPTTHADDRLASTDDPLIALAQRWDVNRNGVYTCGEWKAFTRRTFARADRDHDGAITAREFDGIRKADPVFADTSLAYFDTDGDKRVALPEFVDRENPFFLRYDRDRNCEVTRAEMNADSGVAR